MRSPASAPSTPAGSAASSPKPWSTCWSMTSKTSRSYATITRKRKKALDKALKARDRRCVVPGCRRRIRLEGDHRHDFAKKGPTSGQNMQMLCHKHHDEKTHRGAPDRPHRHRMALVPTPTQARRTRTATRSRSRGERPIGEHLNPFDLTDLPDDLELEQGPTASSRSTEPASRACVDEVGIRARARQAPADRRRTAVDRQRPARRPAPVLRVFRTRPLRSSHRAAPTPSARPSRPRRTPSRSADRRRHPPTSARSHPAHPVSQTAQMAPLLCSRPLVVSNGRPTPPADGVGSGRTVTTARPDLMATRPLGQVVATGLGRVPEREAGTR